MSVFGQALDLQIEAVAAGYRAGVTPVEVIDELVRRIAAGPPEAWITLRAPAEVRADAERLSRDWPDPTRRPPLFGIPFAVKDSVDVAGLPTTVACPDYAYQPERSAPLVDRLLAAGALLVGKTNLDQFATGLVGTRSPYGICTSPFDPAYISGGSSSGSAVAVAAGLVSFAVATDTAGSGRVPAGLCNVVGFKPSRGLVSTEGIVPACRSLDCASVMALSAADAVRVLSVMSGSESGQPVPPPGPGRCPPGLRVGVPRRREFGGDRAAEALFEQACERVTEWDDAIVVPVDLEPFLAAGRLLYDGPWVAERWAEFGAFVTDNPDAIHPVTRQVLRTGAAVTAGEVFAGQRRLAELAARCAPVWEGIDTLLVPTVPTTFTVAEVAADPIARNAFLGHYTHFANLLDLAAVAVPNGFSPAGLPYGVTFLAPAGGDALLAAVAERFQRETGLTVGATGQPLHEPPASDATVVPGRAADGSDRAVLLAVAGTHRTGQPLHPRLAALGARMVGTVHTASAYRLYALPVDDLAPARPGLVRVAERGGAVEVELHRIPVAGLGELLTEIPPPLGLGTVTLADGTAVPGFLCESYAAGTGKDITGYGSWPAYLAAIRQ